MLPVQMRCSQMIIRMLCLSHTLKNDTDRWYVRVSAWFLECVVIFLAPHTAEWLLLLDRLPNQRLR